MLGRYRWPRAGSGRHAPRRARTRTAYSAGCSAKMCSTARQLFVGQGVCARGAGGSRGQARHAGRGWLARGTDDSGGQCRHEGICDARPRLSRATWRSSQRSGGSSACCGNRQSNPEPHQNKPGWPCIRGAAICVERITAWRMRHLTRAAEGRCSWCVRSDSDRKAYATRSSPTRTLRGGQSWAFPAPFSHAGAIHDDLQIFTRPSEFRTVHGSCIDAETPLP